MSVEVARLKDTICMTFLRYAYGIYIIYIQCLKCVFFRIKLKISRDLYAQHLCRFDSSIRALIEKENLTFRRCFDDA